MEILPGIHRLPVIRWSRAYLVEAETLAIVDSGLPWNTGTVLRYIQPISRRPEEVSHILMTHAPLTTLAPPGSWFCGQARRSWPYARDSCSGKGPSPQRRHYHYRWVSDLQRLRAC